MEERDNMLFFESDEDFEDFCIAPYAVIKMKEDGRPVICFDYSDLYKQCLEEGKSFVIKDVNSKVFKRKCACKRVPLIDEGGYDYHRDTSVQLKVENLVDYEDILFEESML